VLTGKEVWREVSVDWYDSALRHLSLAQTTNLESLPLTKFPVRLLRSQNIKTYCLKFWIGNCHMESGT